MALTPIALIPQVVLGGLMVPMTTNPMLKPLMYVMPARWGFEGVDRPRAPRDRAASPRGSSISRTPHAQQPARLRRSAATSSAPSPRWARRRLKGAWGFTIYDQHWLPFAVLYGMTVGHARSLLLILLKRRDPV